MTIRFLQEISLILILFLAALYDLRFQRVPNRLLAIGVAVLLALRFAEGVLPLLQSLFWAILVLLISQPIYRCGMAGAADIKMIVLIVACRPDEKGLFICLLALLAGGGCAVFRLLRGNLWKKRMRHMLWYVRQLRDGAYPPYYLAERDGREAVFPLAGCFLFGAVLGCGLIG